MQITTEFPHDQYGTLILSGQYHEAEPECDLQAHAVLESVLTYDGKELLAYTNVGNQVGVPKAEFEEMEEFLQFYGEPRTRINKNILT
jgi:hypothetical protein